MIAFLQRLLGGSASSHDHPPLAQDAEETEDDSPFKYYNTFSLKDGHLLAQELEKYEIPFEVEFDDGISSTEARFGSGGSKATMTLYIEDLNREILDDLIKLHFH